MESKTRQKKRQKTKRMDKEKNNRETKHLLNKTTIIL